MSYHNFDIEYKMMKVPQKRPLLKPHSIVKWKLIRRFKAGTAGDRKKQQEKSRTASDSRMVWGVGTAGTAGDSRMV